MIVKLKISKGTDYSTYTKLRQREYQRRIRL